MCEKPNVLRETPGLFIRTARQIAKEYPDIELWETNVDAQCMWLIKSPQNYGVIVTSNLFGDILSDLSAQLVGGLGFAASGNIGDKSLPSLPLSKPLAYSLLPGLGMLGLCCLVKEKKTGIVRQFGPHF